MKLYHVARTRSVRVRWLLEELGLDYQLETMPFDPKALQSVDYLELSPFGKVPVLVDGAVTMSESVAIIQYLLLHYGDHVLQPDSASPDYGSFLQWLHFGESTLMGAVSAIAQHSTLLPEVERDPRALARARRQLGHYARVLDEELGRHAYLVGDEFTAADIVVGYDFYITKLFRVFPEDCPNLSAWFDRLMARPAYQTATAA
jgi:glutathione S-transferase